MSFMFLVISFRTSLIQHKSLVAPYVLFSNNQIRRSKSATLGMLTLLQKRLSTRVSRDCALRENLDLMAFVRHACKRSEAVVKDAAAFCACI